MPNEKRAGYRRRVPVRGTELESGLGSNPAHAKASRAGALHSLQR